MATFNSLSIPQQTQVLQHMLDMRGAVGEFSRLMTRIANVQAAWTDHNSALVTSLDGGLLIPDVTGVTPTPNVVMVTGLAGAVPLTREEVISLSGTDFPALLAAYNTVAARALYVKMVGAQNA
jgi:hypothetical protein